MMTALYSIPHKVQYYETDKMGIVHHSNYFRWMEEARTAWLEDIGFGYTEMEAQGIASPVLHICCDYRRPFTYGDTAQIQLRITSYRSTKIEIHYAISDAATGQLHAEGTSSHCFLNAVGRPVSLKRTLPALDALLQQAAQQP